MINLRKIGRKFVLPEDKIKTVVYNFVKNDLLNNILDFGSGTLFWSEWLSEKFHCKVTAYDICYKSNPVFPDNDLIDTVFEIKDDLNYDMIFACDVLHHLKEEEIVPALLKFTQSAKYIVIKDIDACDFFGNLQNKIHDFVINGVKVNNIYINDIERILLNAGFTVEKYYMKKLGYPHFLLLAKNTFK